MARARFRMLFHSLDYIVFLALTLVGAWTLGRRPVLRLVLLFAASSLFYMAWNPAYLALLLAPALLDFFVGRRLDATDDPRRRRRWLVLSVVANLGLLGTFKYFNFFAGAVVDGLGGLGLRVSAPYLDVLLPVGISFYTFQTMSYTIDVYRRRLPAARSLLRYLVFVTFFPQLVAGPIVRATTFLPQLDRTPELARGAVGRGLFLIATGLVKKVVVADYLSVNLVDRVFDNPELFSATEVVVGLYAFTMQIYCDFSGYTDVARGSAALFGLELPLNFDRPYMATSPADYWRRWHMSLSTWLRDYLYFPLGGSRTSQPRAYFNLWLTIFLIGVWHGAAWTFVLYGILQATVLVAHRFFYRRAGRRADTVDPTWLRVTKIAACLQFVVFSRILFRAEDLDNAGDVLARLGSGTTSTAQLSAGVWAVVVLSFAAHYLPRRLFGSAEERFARLPAVAQGSLLAAVGVVLTLVATSKVVPYIYFQF